MYDVSTAPERIPSGGGFSIKNISLLTLWSEHETLRNIWTQTNQDLPLVRYTGCAIKLYQSDRLDYVCSFDTQNPLRSNMDMYHSMHPGVHTLMKHKIIMPSKKTNKNRKPYTKIKFKPPTLLLNKWHFQADTAKTPLLQIRTSSLSLDQYYVPQKSISTTITITMLNTSLIQNTKFIGNSPNGWYARYLGTQQIFLYTTGKTELTPTTKLNTMIVLANTDTYQPGEAPGPTFDKTKWTYNQWGNPFHKIYLTRQMKVYQSNISIATFINKLDGKKEITIADLHHEYNFTEVFITDAIRYNPYRDNGELNEIWLKSIVNPAHGWDPPDNPDLKSGGYPLWVLATGFTDFQKRLGKQQHIDTEYMVVLTTKDPQNPLQKKTMPLLSADFINGQSPYEKSVNIEDKTRWHPSFQMQTAMLNIIGLSGPGSPKLPPLETGECKINYIFYFKWGGNPPPMSRIEDPRNEPTFPMPNNLTHTTSLQNPGTAPETILYNFDQRGQYITQRAIERLQKDWESKKITFTDPQQRMAPEIEHLQETSSETTSEEEEETETLLNKLRKQRLKHKLLKQRILKKLAKLQE